jgi:hypothetical protein
MIPQAAQLAARLYGRDARVAHAAYIKALGQRCKLRSAGRCESDPRARVL